MKNLYTFFDRRTEEQLDYRTLDECIKSIFPRANLIVCWTEEEKIKHIEEAGIIVTKLNPIETCLHTIKGTNEQEKIQVDFNIGTKTISLDLRVEENEGKQYVYIDFLSNSKNHAIFTRSFDEFGNEKCFEICSHCGEEVMLDRIKKVRQTCPSCDEKILACSLCAEDEMNCKICEQDEMNCKKRAF